MKRISVPALAAIALLLVACPKKNTGADGGMDASMPATVDTTTMMVDAGGTNPAPTLATAGKPMAAKPADAGAGGDAGAMMTGDAGAMTATAGDAGAAQLCCCKAAGKYSHSAQSDCTTAMKGACVKKEECEARSCCCDVGGKKSSQFQSECTTTMKGKCVGKDQCK